MTYIPVSPTTEMFDALRCRFEQRYATARAKLQAEIDQLWRSESTHLVLPALDHQDKAKHSMFTFMELPVVPPTPDHHKGA